MIEYNHRIKVVIYYLLYICIINLYTNTYSKDYIFFRKMLGT